MSGQKIITASLEGMRIIVGERDCEVQEYDFEVNEWHSKEILPRPLSRSLADEWVTGWNRVDRFAAMGALTEPTIVSGASTRVKVPLNTPHL